MSKKPVAISVLLTLVLLITIFLPPQASADSDLSLLWEKDFGNDLYNEIAKTSTNGTLLSTVELIDVVQYQKIYRYHVMNLDEKGKEIKTMTLENGLLRIFEYEGSGYVALMNKATMQLELYDEHFKLLMSKPIAYEYVSSLLVQDGIIAVTTGYLTYHDSEAVFYSVDTLEEVDPLTVPIEKYHGTENDSTFAMIGVTFADTIVEKYPVDFKQFTNGAPDGLTYNATRIGNHLYAAIYLYDEEGRFSNPPQSVNLFKFDLQGNIVDQTVISDSGEYSENQILIVGNNMLFSSFQPIQYETQYEMYDLPSLTKNKVIDYPYPYPAFSKLTSELYYYETSEGTTFSDYEDNVKFKKINLGGLTSKSDHYFSAQRNSAYSIYNSQTGEKILDDPFMLTVHNDLIIGHEDQSNGPSGQVYKGKIKLFGKVINDTKNFYNQDKMWTVTFSGNVDSKTITEDTVYVLNKNDEKIEGITFKTINNKVEVYAPENGYTSGESYTLHITSNVQSKKALALKEATSKMFTIK